MKNVYTHSVIKRYIIGEKFEMKAWYLIIFIQHYSWIDIMINPNKIVEQIFLCNVSLPSNVPGDRCRYGSALGCRPLGQTIEAPLRHVSFKSLSHSPRWPLTLEVLHCAIQGRKTSNFIFSQMSYLLCAPFQWCFWSGYFDGIYPWPFYSFNIHDAINESKYDLC